MIDRRIGLLFAGFLFLLTCAFARAVQLGTLQGTKLRRAAVTQQVATEAVPARRGTILDRNGVELAVSQAASDISATPYLVKDPVKAAEAIAPLLRADPDVLTRKLATRGRGFVYLARKVPAPAAEQVAELKIAGIDLQPSEIREYPRRSLASQVLGTVGTDDKGLSGLEWSQNKLLAGTPGERRVVRDALGQTLEITDLRRTRPGARLELTLDAAIQDRVENVLASVGAAYRPKGATAIVLDPRDGEVLAMANWPRVDANDPSSAPDYAHQNRAVGYTYEPGSTFKTITVAGALQNHVVTPDTSFDLPPQITLYDRTIGESHPRGPITLTTSGILARSSNVGAIKIGLALGADRFSKWVSRFGFGRPTGVELPGEERGIVLSRERYSGSSMGNLPIGQGESVTPLQMAAAYSAVANRGILRPPRIIRRIDGHGVRQAPGRRIISASVANQLRTMLKGVLAPGGTASEVSIPGYSLAGKTGTANKVDATTGEYSTSRYVASFVGFAPANDPRLLIAVMVDEPQGAIYGGVVAAPAFGKIASFALPYLKIPPR